MKRIVLVLLTSLSMCQIAWGTTFYSGNEMQEMCRAFIDGTNTAKSGVCAGYLGGISDAQSLLAEWGLMTKHWCIPEGANTDQLARAVLAYLEAHPDKLELAADSLVANVYIVTFPCN
jgi:hypothetical protein